MTTLREAFEAFQRQARVEYESGRDLTVLKAAFITGLKLGMGVAGMPHDEALDVLAAWGTQIDDFYRETTT